MKLIVTIIIFVSGLILGSILTYYVLKERTRAWLKEWKSEKEEEIRKDVAERSRAALKGKVGEQIAPLLPQFKYEPADARFIGSPIDYVIFEGHSKDEAEGISFVDIKTGEKARLSAIEEKFKKAVEDGKVRWRQLE